MRLLRAQMCLNQLTLSTHLGEYWPPIIQKENQIDGAKWCIRRKKNTDLDTIRTKLGKCYIVAYC